MTKREETTTRDQRRGEKTRRGAEARQWRGEMTRKRDDTRRGKRWGETSGRRTDENEKEGRDGDKGRFGSYLKLCDFTLLFMTLQVELRLNKRIISETQTS